MNSARMKSILGRAGFVLAVAAAFLALVAPAQMPGEGPCLDEALVRQAMHEEAFRLLAQKIDFVRDATAGGFDYHIDQAYEKIKGRLPSDALSQTELEAWLGQFLQRPPAGKNESEFQVLIGDFIKGMSLEIINTLQFECEQAEDLVERLTRLGGWMKKAARCDRGTLERSLRLEGLGRKTGEIIINIHRDWRAPSEQGDDFVVFSTLKKNMTGQKADPDQRLIFDLGDRYRQRHPFLDGFMKNYRLLAERFRRTALEVNALLASD